MCPFEDAYTSEESEKEGYVNLVAQEERCFLLPQYVVISHIIFTPPSIGNYSLSNCRFSVSLGGGKFRIFLLHHQSPLLAIKLESWVPALEI